MPSVFISYSHDPNDPGHGDKVAGFAASLLASGLKVYFDQNRDDDEEGVPWPIWMESKIDAADFVLLVCTKLYLDKVQQRVDANEGLGVFWEANLIYNYLYVAKLNTTKFLPVLLTAEHRKFIPRPLVGANSFVVDSNSAFTRLYAFLTGQHRSHFSTQASAIAILRQKTVQPIFSVVDGQEAPASGNSAPSPAPAAATPTFILKTDAAPKPRQDIRGLDWYEECDATHFLGREDETDRLLAMLLSQPVIRLIGPSGVGKSSLIRAGLLPKIREFGWRACVLRPFEDPFRRIPEQLTDSLLVPGQSFSSPLSPEIVRRELSAALTAAGTKRIVLLLDQFEDIVSPSAATNAVDSMRLWLRELWEQAEATPFLRVIVVYRTDADARLGRLWQEITGRSEGLPYLPVEGLSQKVGAKIIRQAARERSWQIKASLPEITGQLALESQKLGCSGDVFPVYLQILLKQIAEEGNGRLTSELMESLGGVAGLIGRFLEQSLARLKARGGDWQHCGRVLEALSRSSGTKSAVSLEDLVRECGLSRVMLTEMLTVLIQERLVRPIGYETYEIQHDRLASAVIDSMKDNDREAKQAREFLAAKIPLFERTRTPLSGAELGYLYRHRRFIHPSSRELPVLLASALNAIIKDSDEDWRGRVKIAPIPFAFWFSKLEQRDWWKMILQVEQWRHDNSRMLATSRDWADAFPVTSLEKELTNQTRDPAPAIRRLCAVWLRTLAVDSHAPLLCNLAQDGDIDVRREAVKALAGFRQEQSLPRLLDLAKDEDRHMRIEAVHAIAGFQHEQALSILRDLAKDNDSIMRREAAKALAAFKQEQSLPLLLNLAKDEDPYVRVEAAKALASLQHAKALPLLRRLANEKRGHVCIEAVNAIAGIQQQLSFPLLRNLTKSKDGLIRRMAVKTLAGFQEEKGLPMWQSLAQDKDSYVRLEAARVIASLQQEQGLPLLLDLTKNEDLDVCLEAVKAIAGFQQEQALQLMLDLAKSEINYVRPKAVKAIAGLALPSRKRFLVELAFSPENEVSSEAVLGLESLLSRNELAKLLDEHEPSLSTGAVAALDRILYMPKWLKAGLYSSKVG